jgi:hypothetical protein
MCKPFDTPAAPAGTDAADVQGRSPVVDRKPIAREGCRCHTELLQDRRDGFVSSSYLSKQGEYQPALHLLQYSGVSTIRPRGDVRQLLAVPAGNLGSSPALN